MRLLGQVVRRNAVQTNGWTTPAGDVFLSVIGHACPLASEQCSEIRRAIAGHRQAGAPLWPVRAKVPNTATALAAVAA
jgi:hypothetical protein